LGHGHVSGATRGELKIYATLRGGGRWTGWRPAANTKNSAFVEHFRKWDKMAEKRPFRGLGGDFKGGNGEPGCGARGVVGGGLEELVTTARGGREVGA